MTQTAQVAGQTFDAVVVGSGASGGWAAKRLSEAGLQVCLLDAGRALTDADYKEHVPAYALPYRARADELIRQTRPKQRDCYACREWNYDWFVNDIDEPYTTPRDKPFAWMGRMRVVGGRTNVWGRQSYRLGDIDFKAARFDDAGNKTAPAHAIVRHNGVLIHDRDLVLTPGGVLSAETKDPGPVFLQHHGNPVRYRNIWVVKK